MASEWCGISPCPGAVYQTAGAASLIPAIGATGEKNETTLSVVFWGPYTVAGNIVKQDGWDADMRRLVQGYKECL